MKLPWRQMFCGALLTALWSSSAVAEEQAADPAEMLKVPPAEARPAGEETDAKGAAKPAPEVVLRNTPLPCLIITGKAACTP